MDGAPVSFIIQVLASLTLFGQILIIVLLGLLIVSIFKKKPSSSSVFKFLSQNSLYFAFFVSSIAVAGSLFLSEIALFTPCKLCWFQRIFMYPQVVILGIGAFKDDFNIKKYSIVLSIFGFLIASYHYLLQLYPNILQCNDEVASCSAKQFASFGYITIPMMSATAFLLIILFLFLARRK
ncbi:MAG: disulfide bond formation protein B [Candidatus Levybacteria bacterium CG10_big_fil_rev_8_21_14_0_10_36_7]|nr:MAG: disulfide bond formation protein B [Candidatus Levybacteria bacterium CG10_big_fil_rev_8_21_14_0_10_36_7]